MRFSFRLSSGGMTASLLLFLFIVLELQCWMAPGGYSRLRSHGSAWRIISRDGELWFDRTDDYVQSRWLRIQGWYFFDAFFGDPIIGTRSPTNWIDWIGLLFHFSSGAKTRWVIAYWPIAVIGMLLSIPSIATIWRKQGTNRQQLSRDPTKTGLFIIHGSVIGAMLVLSMVSLSGLLILVGIWLIGIWAYWQCYPVFGGYPMCWKCGYNLTRNESGICPGCGTSVAQTKYAATAGNDSAIPGDNKRNKES